MHTRVRPLACVALVWSATLLAGCHNERAGERLGSTQSALDVTESQVMPLLGSPADQGYYGYSVGVSGDRALVTHPTLGNGGYASGAALFFAYGPGGYGIEQIETPPLPASQTSDQPNGVVALEGTTAMINPYQDNAMDKVLVYSHGPTGWSLQQTLLPGGLAGDFGDAMALHGDDAVIARPGYFSVAAVHMFERTGGVWSETQVLAPATGSGSSFGRAVALEQDTLMVGTPGAFSGDPSPGIVHVFTRQNGTWLEQQTLQSPNPVAGGGFGRAVAIVGDLAMIGSTPFYGSMPPSMGTVYLFRRINNNWQWQASLTPSTQAMDHGFG